LGVKLPVIKIGPPTDHFSEILLLGIIAVGMVFSIRQAISLNHAAEASAYTAVLMAIVSAIKERWTQRSVDRMGQSLANAPPSDPPATEPTP
jgi:hypothetical protein